MKHKAISSSLASSDQLSPELIKELRESARMYLRLDLTYLAAVGVFITVLRINHTGAIRFVASTPMHLIIILYVFRFFLDTELYASLIRGLLSPEYNSTSHRAKQTLHLWYLKTQPYFHYFLILLCIAGGQGAADEHTEFRSKLNNRVLIQYQIDRFIYQYKRVPESLEDIRKVQPSINRLIMSLGDEPVLIEKEEKPLSYRVTFGGTDMKIGTEDDCVGTSDSPLSQLQSALENEDNKN